MELRYYLDILKRRWRIALLVALIVIGLGWLASMLMSPKYQAEATLRMITPLAGSPSGTSHETTFANRLINTYAQIATSTQVRNEVKEKVGGKALPAISVNIIPDSEIIQLDVESDNPALAAKTANALAEILVSYQDSSQSSEDSKELNLLGDRVNSSKAELDAYQQQHDQLSQKYSESTAELDVLDRQIRLKEGAYQSLVNQYELLVANTAGVIGGTAPRQRDAMAGEIQALQKELDSLHLQFKDLSVNSNTYLQQITLLRLSIQSAEATHANLLGQYDAVHLAQLRQENAQKIIIVSPAVQPSAPSGPSRSFVVVLGAIVALLAGIVAAFLRDTFDPHIHSPEQLGRLTSTPVLGSISKYTQELSGNPGPAVERDFWMLRARLQTLIQESSAKIFLVTSPNRAEGKSTITYRLAVGLAQYGYKVLVVDANMRAGMQHKLFEVTGEQGLSDFLRGEEGGLKGFVLKNIRPGIDLVPSMTKCDNPIELLQYPRLTTLFDSLKAYDLVLIDTPAVLEFPDGLALSKLVDAVLLVAQWDQTTSDDIRITCSQLQTVGSKIAGTVFNQTRVGKGPSSDASGTKQRFRPFKEVTAFLTRSRSVQKAVSTVGRGTQSK